MMKNKLAHDVSLCCLLFRNPLFQTVNNCHPRCVRVAAILFVIYMLPYSFFAPLTRLKTREINASDDFVGSPLVVVVFFRLAFLSLCSVAKGVCFCCCFGTHRTDGCDGLRAICCCCSCVFKFPSSLARGVKRVLQTK